MPLLLRAVEPRDAELLFNVENDMSTWPDSDSSAPYSAYMLRKYAENYDGDPFGSGQLRLIACENNNPDLPIGILDFYNISLLHSHAWTGIYILPSYRRKGNALELLGMAKKYASENLRLSNLGAKILESNIPSLRLFERAGFKTCGLLPKWRFANGEMLDLHLLVVRL